MNHKYVVIFPDESDRKLQACIHRYISNFKRAFDTVNHQILIDKLFHFGIRGVAFSLSKSYLQDRKQYVDINGTKSSYAEINIGVPQGAVLGSLLFIFYINDKCVSSKYLQFIHYADDRTAFISGPDNNDIILTINNELDDSYIWLQSNRLTLNASEISFMIHGNVQILNTPTFVRNEHILETTSAKFVSTNHN